MAGACMRRCGSDCIYHDRALRRLVREVASQVSSNGRLHALSAVRTPARIENRSRFLVIVLSKWFGMSPRSHRRRHRLGRTTLSTGLIGHRRPMTRHPPSPSRCVRIASITVSQSRYGVPTRPK